MVNAECEKYKCSSVKVESIELGSAGPLIKTNGTESNLACEASYEQLSILLSRSSYKTLKALTKTAKDHNLSVDLHLYHDIKPCAIESLIIYSEK